MYVIVRTLRLQKGLREQYTQRFSMPSPVTKAKGFIRRDVLFSQRDKEYDVCRIIIYWQDKKAFYAWEGSPEHIAMHKNKVQQKDPNILESTHEAFEVIASIEHE